MADSRDKQIIDEAVRFVNEGVAVTFAVRGASMLPFIHGGHDSVVLTRPGEVRVGDVVLARIGEDHYVLHRVKEIDGDRVKLLGDGNLGRCEACTPGDILARADEVVKPDGTRRRIDAASRRAVRTWTRLLPVRRYLLAIYRRTIIRNITIQ